MEISSTILEQGLDGLNELALPIVGASCLYLMLRGPRAALVPAVSRPRRRRSRIVRRGVSLLSVLLAVPSPAPAGTRRASQGAAAASSVRTEPGGFPPPRPLGSAGPSAGTIDEVRRPGVEGPPRVPVDRPAPAVRPPWRGDDDGARPPARVHAAIHGGEARGFHGPLFGRWHAAPPADAHAAQAEARSRWHAVLPGETLWSIAAERLRTDDVRRIARYWPRIHRANRDEIGPNPDLIRPGQVLELPPEHA